MEETVTLDIYKFEKERISGMGEGEHSAPILSKRPGMQAVISVTELRKIKKTQTYFYRLDDGTPYGPGGFYLYDSYGNERTTIQMFILIEPDVDIY